MKEVFVAVKAFLKTKLPDLNTLTRWNNQLENESTESVQTFPAVYYQLDGLKTTTISRGIQQAEGILRIRHCAKALRGAQLTGVDLEATTYLALQAWKGGPITTGLDRVAIYPDPNYGAVEVIISEYHIKYTDASWLNARVQLVPGQGLDGVATVVLQ
ncbi:hypothetical protein QMK33_00360 [Hymenobacter sp. H14-R3]|uniref:hypothetical protein n=1 Tax=Hymenobacter sp. H14-R3 TaxID=3046308 RepID=UPI0024BA643E|nr:hypothetical protein [Hymenobacter sp. H14-R3]MDJ0363586.1 hypothetical protein [Hymenobacter sp. H14-R3]